MFGQNSTSFGSQPAANNATTTFNNNNNTLFGANTTTTPTNTLFGANTTPTNSLTGVSTNTSSLFGTSTTSTSTFGNTIAASTPASTNSTLFGAKPATTTNTLFGSAPTVTSTPAATNTLFGSTPSSNTLFGAKPVTTTSAATTITTTTTSQEQHFLDIQYCFPNTNMSSYIIKPESITRSTNLVNHLFGNNNKSNDSNRHLRETSIEYNEKHNVLPRYLSATDPSSMLNSSNKSSDGTVIGKKRILEQDTTEEGRNVLFKSQQGLFAHSDNYKQGFDKNKKSSGFNIPTKSVHDLNSSLKEIPHQDSPTKLTAKKTRVRVFGYDPNKMESVIDFFTKLGNLFEPYSTQGNWIIFNYTSPEVAQKAISYNGMMINQDHMVGVTWDDGLKQIEVLQDFRTTTIGNDIFKINSSSPSSSSTTVTIDNHMPKQNGMLYRLREKFMGW